nr:MAG TPA: hypothetical protein [Herelleviridae sp.]
MTMNANDTLLLAIAEMNETTSGIKGYLISDTDKLDMLAYITKELNSSVNFNIKIGCTAIEAVKESNVVLEKALRACNLLPTEKNVQTAKSFLEEQGFKVEISKELAGKNLVKFSI